MSKFLRLIIVAFAGLVASVSAFTVAPLATTSMRSASPMTAGTSFQQGQGPHQSSTSLSIMVDSSIADMISKSSPVGAIMMLVLVVSFWELATPGRAKKN